MPAEIAAGLQTVELKHDANYGAEAACLLGWVRKGLVRGGCQLASGAFVVKQAKCEGSFELQSGYADPKKSFPLAGQPDKNCWSSPATLAMAVPR